MNGTAAKVKRLGRLAECLCLAFALGACSHPTGKGPGGLSSEIEKPNGIPQQVEEAQQVERDEEERIGRGPDRDIEDLRRIPQKFEALPAVADGAIGLDESCRSQLLACSAKIFWQ